MPHFIIKGADPNTAEDRLLFGFYDTPDEAESAASEAGVFIASIEALDEGDEPRRNDGMSGGWLRMATKLKRQDRYDEAVEVLFAAFRKAVREGMDITHETLLRVPKYLILGGRKDEAWGILNEMKIGQFPGVKEFYFGPAILADIHKVMATICSEEQAKFHNLIFSVCNAIHLVSIGYSDADQAMDEIERYFGNCGLELSNPDQVLASIRGKIEAIDPDSDQGTKAALFAESTISSAIVW